MTPLAFHGNRIKSVFIDRSVAYPLGSDDTLLILLVASSDTPSTLDSVIGLTTVSVRRGHEVAAFFHMGGVNLLKASQASNRLATFASEGVRLLACRTSANERGIESTDEFVEGAEMSSLGELVELLDRCDRALFLG